MTVRVAMKSGRIDGVAVAINHLGPADNYADLMRYFDEPEKYAVPKTRSTPVDRLQRIFTSLMGCSLAAVERSILTIMRSDEFLGSKWTPEELHYFLSEAQFGNREDEGRPEHFWTNLALDRSVHRALASLKRKGLVRHTVLRPRWFGMLPEIRWSLVSRGMSGAHHLQGSHR